MTPQFPGYEVLAELADDGRTAVYKAKEIESGRMAALKVRDLTEPLVRRRMLREARFMAAVRHPAVVAAHRIEEVQPGRLYIAMDYVDGGSLSDKLGVPWPPERAAEFIETIARGVQAVHEVGAVHGAVEPDHILLTNDGKPKLAGFGCTRAIGTVTQGGLMGRPSYMAPETITEQGGVAPSMDLFSIGSVLYEMLTGCPPYREESALKTIQKLVSQPPMPPRELQPTIPAALEAICLKCLERKPEHRYQTAAALADDLRRFLER